MAETTTVTIADITAFKLKALVWANLFPVVCLLDSNNYPHKEYTPAEWLLAVDAVDYVSDSATNSLSLGPAATGINSFEKLQHFQANAGSSIFGFLGYDLKNEIEALQSANHDGLQFPDFYFFKPRFLLEITGSKLTVNRNYPETFELIEQIEKLAVNGWQMAEKIQNTKLKARTAKSTYLQNIESIRQQIIAGDFYEMNYCNEFYAGQTELNPLDVFTQLNAKAQAPFSCYFKLNDKYLLCASPERFLKKEGTKLISQPIKGTIRKGETEAENELLKSQLRTDEKERAENIMIVDLVRNDLAKSSKPGSVVVEELCGIYEFASVNQMISTVTSQMEDTGAVGSIKNAFPMGSMTGAPKVEVMKNIERYEDFKRGLYSGSVGYFTPNGDFDFNVVIRSILYNATEKYLSIRVGGAITYDSIAENEWEEILLKAQSTMQVLGAGIET